MKKKKLSRADELMASIKSQPAFLSVREKMSAKERKLSDDLVENFVAAFAPAIEMLENIANDPALAEEFRKAMTESKPDDSSKDEDPKSDKSST
jgi:uncharacterized protein (UPF0147 family)